MDPSNQWQQPDPNGVYGPVPQGQPPGQPYAQPQYPPPQYPPPQHPPPQHPAQPYSAQPYASQPYSGPPANPNQQYQQPGQYQQPNPYQQPGPYQADPVPPPSRRNRWFAALVISAVLLVIVTIAVVVVATNRDPDPVPQAGGASGSPTGPVDPCLVGSWKQTNYQRNVVLGDTDVGTRENLGTIKMTGAGKQWTIKADGSAVEDDSKTVYSGKTTDGRNVTATFSGKTDWTLKTADGRIEYAGKDSTAVVVISVNGADKGKIELEPNLDPGKYTCTGDFWRTVNNDDPDSFSRYDRVK